MLATARGATPNREKAGERKIVIVSDNEAIGQVTQAHAKVWTVHSVSLLKGGWLNVRDNALKNATALWLELPSSTTASGTKKDRRRT